MALQSIEDISLKGFIVVKHQMFERTRIPTITISNRKMLFSKDCHTALDNCQSIQVLVNYEQQLIVVKPTSSSEDDSISWRNDKLMIPNINDIPCPLLTQRLYREWNLNSKYRYRSKGKLVKSDNKLMLLFDFNSADLYEGMKLVERHE